MTCLTRPWEYSYILIVQSIMTDRENVVAYIIVQSIMVEAMLCKVAKWE